MLDKIYQYCRLARLHKPVGWLLLIWPTLWALWIAAEGSPPIRMLIIFVLGTILMRGAGCVINDYFDREIDRQVARTKDRPLAIKAVTENEALIIFGLLVFSAFILVLMLNTKAIITAAIGLSIACVYPLAKRFTYMPQAILGVAFSWGIPMAFVSIEKNLHPLAWYLLMANFCWTIAYDTMYAMVDRPDDIKAKIKSSAILFGKYDRVINSFLQIIALFILILVVSFFLFLINSV